MNEKPAGEGGLKWPISFQLEKRFARASGNQSCQVIMLIHSRSLNPLPSVEDPSKDGGISLGLRDAPQLTMPNCKFSGN